MYEAKGSEIFGLLGSIDPVSHAAGTLNSGWIEVSEAIRFMAVLSIGLLGSTGSPAVFNTVDAKFQQATSSGGAGAKDITGAAIVQHTTGNGKQLLVNVASEQLDVTGGFTYVQFSVTIAGSANTAVSALIVDTMPRNLAAAQPASVTQVVN